MGPNQSIEIKTKNKKQAERIEAKARVAAESGESLQPKRAPLIQDFAKQFLEWLDKTTLEQKTKNDYKNGRRLILQSALCGMRMDQITSDDVENFTNRPTAEIALYGPCAGCWARAATGSCFVKCQELSRSKFFLGIAW